MRTHNHVTILLAMTTNLCFAQTWSNLYLGLTAGNLTRNYESQQLKLAQNKTLLSETYNLSFDRGLIYTPKSNGLNGIHIQSSSYSAFEIDQHGSALSISTKNLNAQQSASIGLAGLYNTEENFGFLQSNLGTTITMNRAKLALMLNIPIKKQHLFDSNMSQQLFSIANNSRGNNLSNEQKKQVVQTILNQAVTDQAQINTIYDTILTVQAGTSLNHNANYQPVFEQYSDKTSSLYHRDLLTANRAGSYDLIAQYGMHAKIAYNHLWQTNHYTTAAFTTLSYYEKQKIINTGIDFIDLTGNYKTASPQIQILYSDKQWRLRGAVSLKWYIDKPSHQAIYFPHELGAELQHVNYTAKTFTATNLNA